MTLTETGRSRPSLGNLAPAMPGIFWLGCGFVAVFFLGGVMIGARSRSSSAASGALMGLFLGIMAAFPFLAIGLSTS
jgi:hypothetical protein